MKAKIAIVADTLAVPWGGSEELWSQAAIQMVSEGMTVSACIHGRLPLHHRVQELMRRGVEVRQRGSCPIWKRVWRKVLADQRNHEIVEIENFLLSFRPSLAVLSTGGALPSIGAVEFCGAKKIPFVTVSQSNFEGWWFEDEVANRYRSSLPAALRCYFVSKANLQLTEKQIGCELTNAEIIRNPFNVNIDASPPWPRDNNGEIRFACVARLDPPSKGQDILLEALASPAWINRRWHLRFYGDGPMRTGIERLIERFDLGDRVTLVGFVSQVEEIWAENHTLVLPSRREGLPIAIVEAMLCARPVIATNVAGNSEIVEDGVTGFLADAPTVASMATALERFWERRTELRKMGQAAANSIRKSVPKEPVKAFSEKIKCLISQT